MLAGPTQIVEDGVFRRGITDLYSATPLGIPRSANGRRQDFTRKAYAAHDEHGSRQGHCHRAGACSTKSRTASTSRCGRRAWKTRKAGASR